MIQGKILADWSVSVSGFHKSTASLSGHAFKLTFLSKYCQCSIGIILIFSIEEFFFLLFVDFSTTTPSLEFSMRSLKYKVKVGVTVGLLLKLFFPKSIRYQPTLKNS